MNRERAIGKLKKCLRLAQSSNAHEAAAALRQAQALMREYGLSEQDASDRDAPRRDHAPTGARGKEPPIQVSQLALLCADLFGCKLVMSTERRTGTTVTWHALFFGIGAAPTVAAFSFTVLRRQMERDTRKHLRRVRKAENRRGGAARFGVGWVVGVRALLQPAQVSTEEARAIQQLVSTSCGPLVIAAPKRADDLNAGRNRIDDYVAGERHGRAAQLRRGVGGSSAAPVRQLECQERTNG